jgi:hypothetical protein
MVLEKRHKDYQKKKWKLQRQGWKIILEEKEVKNGMGRI